MLYGILDAQVLDTEFVVTPAGSGSGQLQRGGEILDMLLSDSACLCRIARLSSDGKRARIVDAPPRLEGIELTAQQRQHIDDLDQLHQLVSAAYPLVLTRHGSNAARDAARRQQDLDAAQVRLDIELTKLRSALRDLNAHGITRRGLDADSTPQDIARLTRQRGRAQTMASSGDWIETNCYQFVEASRYVRRHALEASRILEHEDTVTATGIASAIHVLGHGVPQEGSVDFLGESPTVDRAMQHALAASRHLHETLLLEEPEADVFSAEMFEEDGQGLLKRLSLDDRDGTPWAWHDDGVLRRTCTDAATGVTHRESLALNLQQIEDVMAGRGIAMHQRELLPLQAAQRFRDVCAACSAVYPGDAVVAAAPADDAPTP